MLRTFIEVTCDGGCGTVSRMLATAFSLQKLQRIGWTTPMDHRKKEYKHYCGVCTRARLTGTI